MGKSKSNNKKITANDVSASDNQDEQAGTDTTTAVDEAESTVKTEESVDNSESSEAVELSEAADDENLITTSAYVDRIEETENGGGRIVLYTDDEDNPEKFVLPASMVPKDIKPDDSVIVKIMRNA